MNSRILTILQAKALLSILVFATPGLAQVPVSQCGQVLSEPGEYVLTTSLNCQPPNNVGLRITASRVHLDTAGHAVGVFAAPALVINDGLSHIRIDGGGSFGPSGVSIGADRDVVLSNLGFTGENMFSGGVALGINGATQVTVTHCAIGTGGYQLGGSGIAAATDHGVFTDNTIGASGHSVAGGIFLSGTHNVIHGNTISIQNSYGTAYGISVTSDTLITNNTINLDPDDIGINLGGDSNLVRDNTIQASASAALYGIFAAQGAIDNTITNNMVSGNQFDLFESNGPPCVNVWKHNHFQTSGGAVACIN